MCKLNARRARNNERERDDLAVPMVHGPPACNKPKAQKIRTSNRMQIAPEVNGQFPKLDTVLNQTIRPKPWHAHDKITII